MNELQNQPVQEEHPLSPFFSDEPSRLFASLVWQRQTEQAQDLVQRGIPLNKVDPSGFCFLTFFMHLRDIESFQRLLDWGASPDLTSVEMAGMTPLMLSVGIPEPEFLEACIAARGDVNRLNEDGDSALILAAAGGNETAVRLLLAHGANVNQQGAMKTTALHEAAKEGYRSIVDLLQAAGANADLKDEYDETARQLLAA